MKKLFFTPGPSQLFPSVKKDFQEGLRKNIYSISHRSKTFEDLYQDTIQKLRLLLNIPSHYNVFFVSSGTEAMERIVENCVESKSFHFINGSFSKRFFLTAQELRKLPEKNEVALGQGFDLSHITIPSGTELICFTHNETSTGVMIPLQEIYQIKKRYSSSLIALDIVSSVPYGSIDFSLLDCVFFSIQKGFGLPAGLGVIITSPNAIEKAKNLQKKGTPIGSYHSFPSLLSYAIKNQTPETPSVLHIFLLNKVLDNMLITGITKLQADTDKKAQILYNFLDNHSHFKPFVTERKFRSPTVIVIQTNSQTKQIKAYLETKGIFVGNGYGKNKDIQLRIANFPAISLSEMKKLVGYLSNY